MPETQTESSEWGRKDEESRQRASSGLGVLRAGCSLFPQLKISENKHSKTDINQELEVLRTKVQKHIHAFIPEEKQTSISNFVDEKLEEYNIIPRDPGSKVNLDHLQTEEKLNLEHLIQRYNTSFAEHKFDIGRFLGFQAVLAVEEGAKAFEAPRPMKQSDAK